ncbi:MAG: AsmA-like C-terminal domain-containing protein, partial [Thermodesulfobacteriota bacterium]
VMIDADPAQIPPVLKQFVHDKSFEKEMDLIKDVKGTAKGRLIISGQKGSAEAKVNVSEFQISAGYGRFPYPVSVKGGTFDYEDMKIDVAGLDVSMGKSSSSIASGSYEWKDNDYLVVSSTDTTVDLGEFSPRLASFVSLKPLLKDIESARGTAFFKTLEFAGTVTNPADWKISGEGRLSAVNLNLTGFNDLITITGADIKSTPGRLSVSNAGVSVHDSNINLSMELTNYLTSLINMKMDFAGTLDPGTMKSLSEYIDLPKELVFNTPLSVTDSSLELGDGGGISSEGLNSQPGTPLIHAEKKLNLNVNIRTDKLEWRDAKTKTAANGEPPGKAAWNSPVTGTVRVKSENFIFKKLNWDTLNAAVKLFKHGIDIDVTHAELCGISTPGKLQVYPPGLRFEFKPSTSDEDLASVVKCLLNKAGIISGELQFNAVVSSDGGAQDLYKNLEGGMELTSRNGRVEKYGGLAKFFNVLNFGELFRGQGPDFNKQGFPYDKLTAKADMKDGKVIIKQAAMDGPSIKVVCEGFIDLVNEKLDLQLLVIPVMAVDSVIKKIPIVNFVLGKNFVSIPIRVKGDITDPKVETISPSAISFGLFGLIKQTLNIPATIFKPVSKRKKNVDDKEDVSKGINSGEAGNTGE